MDNRYVESFEVGDGPDRVSYTVMLAKDGELRFFAEARNPAALGFEDDSWDMPETYVTYASFGSSAAPVRVMRRIAGIVSNWIENRGIDYFYFSSPDAHKIDVYMRLAARIPGMVEFDCSISMVDRDYIANFFRI